MDRLVYLDTCCVIYLLEDVQPFSALIRQHLANNLDAILCVSPLVRLESPLAGRGLQPRPKRFDFGRS